MTGVDDLVEPLPWDSDFWGVSAARITARTPEELEVADAQCIEDKVRWSSTMVELSNVELLNAAVRRGHEIVDVRHTIERALDDADRSAPFDLARAEDIDGMAEIARPSFTRSRFFVDRHLEDDRCETFFETWLRNSANGRMADAIAVTRHEGVVEGFFTVRLEPGQAGSLQLGGVRETARGRGVGTAALASALGWLANNGGTSVFVHTQLSNLPAVRFFQAARFRTVSCNVWLHRWY